MAFWTFQFTTPIALVKSNQAISNYYDSFSELRLFFYQQSSSNVHFPYDLGFGATAVDIDCWNCEDLITYRPSLSCKMIKGKTSSVTSADYVLVRIMNYKALSIGKKVCFSMMAEQINTAAGTAQPKLQLGLYSIQQAREYQLAFLDLTSSLGNAGNNVGANFAGGGLTMTATPTSMTVFSAQEVKLDFQLAATAVKADNPIFKIQFPTDWTWSVDRTQPTRIFFGTTEVFSSKYYWNSLSKILVITPKDDLVTTATYLKVQNIFTPSR
jgi:hypothetical protein